MDCHDSNLIDTKSGTQDWPDHLRDHAALYRELAELTDDAFIKNEMLDLAALCEKVAADIEHHQTLH